MSAPAAPTPDATPAPGASPPRKLLSSTRSVVLRNLSTGYTGRPAYKPWQPPLRNPTAVNNLLSGYQPQHLSIPVGIIDLPFYHRLDTWTINLTGLTNSVAIGGLTQSGKTTFLQTMIVAGAYTHSPVDLQFFCLDFSGGRLMALERLPHVASVATRTELSRISRTLAQLKATADFREQIMTEYRLSWESYRKARLDPNHPASRDPYSDIVFVIDGWDNVIADDWMPADAAQGDHDKYIEAIYALARRGANVGIHMAIGLNRWTMLRQHIRSSIGLKIDLFPADETDVGIENQRAARQIPKASPGRAMSTHAMAYDGVEDDFMHVMIGAPRLDGRDTMADLDSTYDHTADIIAKRWETAAKPPKMGMLPAKVSYAQVAAKIPAATPQDPETVRWELPVALGESNLGAVSMNLMEHPHVLVFGENESGKSETLRTIAKAITDRNSPDQVRFVVVDYDGTLEGAVPAEFMVPPVTQPDGTVFHTYIRNYMELNKSSSLIQGGLEPRRQPATAAGETGGTHSWWEGPEIVLLCDDWDQIITNHPAQYAALQVELAEHIQSRTSGFHFIAACHSSKFYTLTAMAKGALGVAWTRNGHVLVHSGSRDDYSAKEIVVRKRRQGEAMYLRKRQQVDVVQIATVDTA